MVRLFLENKEVELDSNIQFAINKQFEDISSPTDIKNDWSKTVQIPFTQSNNKLFGELFNVDRLIVDGDEKLMGIYFNPYKKVDFRLQWGDTIIMQGYAKNIDVVKSANGEGHYNITLNGELGKCFQEMKKITFDTTTEDTKYLIDGSKYVDETINKDLVYKLWTTTPTYNNSVEEKYVYMKDLNTGETFKSLNPFYRIQDIIGFAPNNSYNENFDYTTYELKNGKTKTFAETLDEEAKKQLGNDNATYADITGISADSIIGDGLLPREIGEYRSYMQLPYIYFNKLFQIFMEKTKEITGYNVELADSWFNIDNPYWSKLVYMLNPLNTKKSETIENQYDVVLYSDNIYEWNNTNLPTTHLNFNLNPVRNNSTEEIPVVDWTATPPVFNVSDNILTVNENYTILLEAGAVYDGIDRQDTRLNKLNGLVVELNILYDNNTKDTTKTLFIDESATVSYTEEDYNSVIKLGKGYYGLASLYSTWDLNIPSLYALYSKEGALTAKIEITAYWLNNNDCFDNVKYGRLDGSSNMTLKVNVVNNTQHSFANFTLNDLWNNEYNLFDEILNYCKQYRIGVFCDNIDKKLIFKPLASYFSGYQILDWTAKLDLSKEYHIKPIVFENKYLLFNYEKYETELNQKYNEKYGLNYGEYRLTTNYEFNNEEKKLFKSSKIAIANTDVVLSWGNIYDNTNVIYTLPAEISVYNKDKDRKNVNIFGSMLFFNGLSNWDTASKLRSVKISDDTALQLSLQKYFYSQGVATISVPTYPMLDIVADSNLSTFAKPNENYTYISNSYNDTNDIYKNFWENYLNERYNKQNKIVSCYLYLTPFDFANFEYNNFVKIENQLYMVNKIYDYQVSEYTSTKVDLITIQDIKGYTDNNFNI